MEEALFDLNNKLLVGRVRIEKDIIRPSCNVCSVFAHLVGLSTGVPYIG